MIHQARPTAKGHHFITMEDEGGFINVIARPDVYAKYRKVFRDAAHAGEVQHQGAVVNLIAEEAVPLAV